MKKFRLLLILVLCVYTSISMMSQVTKKQIGNTRFDLQTNNSIQRRIVLTPNNYIIATYTGSSMIKTVNGEFTDRGSGYAFFDGTSWTPASGLFTTRVESDRVGWGSPFVTDSGEFILSHLAGATTEGLNVSRRSRVGSGSWIDSKAAPDGTWSRTVSSGNNVVAITSYSTGTSTGPSLNGLIGGIDFIKSTNGGVTWSQRDSIPGVNTTNYSRLNGDVYALDVQNSRIAVLTGLSDVTLYYSNNFGTTWSKKTLIEGNNFATATDTVAMDNRSDGTYEVVFDNNNKMHCFWGRNYSNNVDARVEVSGLMYWNEDMGSSKPIVIPPTIYLNEGKLRPTNQFPYYCLQRSVGGAQQEYQSYNTQYISQPSAGVDANNNLYVTFAKVRSNVDTTAANTGIGIDRDQFGMNMTDIYMVKSYDNGKTWVGPLNVSNTLKQESVYASVAKKVTDKVHVVYQEDTAYGIVMDNNTSPTSQSPQLKNNLSTDNKIIYAAVDTGAIVTPTDITAPFLRVNSDFADDLFFPISDTLKFIVGCNTELFSQKTRTSTLRAFLLQNIVDVIDNKDGIDSNLLQIITPNGPVNFSVAGNYPIRLLVKDKAGNTSSFLALNNSNSQLTLPYWDTIDMVVSIVNPTNAKPTISLNGSSPVYVYLNKTFTDPGAVFSHDNPCVASSVIKRTPTITTNAIGKFTYTYYCIYGTDTAKAIREVYVGKEPSTAFINEALTGTVVSATSTTPDISSDFKNTKYTWTTKGYAYTLTPTTATLSFDLSTRPTIIKFDSLCLKVENDFTTNIPTDAQPKTVCKSLKYTSSISNLNKTNFDVVAYPNPSNGEINLQFKGVKANSKANIVIYSIDGKQVYSSLLTATDKDYSIDLKDLGKGIYLMNTEINGVTNKKKIEILK